MILWWQILLLTLYAGFQIMDELHWYSSAGSAVFSGFITGLIMGDMATGLFIGGSMQLTILGVGTFGGASRIDANSGTLIATAFAVSSGMDPEQALAALGVPSRRSPLSACLWPPSSSTPTSLAASPTPSGVTRATPMSRR